MPKADKTKFLTPFYYVGVNTIKDIVNSGTLMTHGGGANYSHIPNYDIYDREWALQMLSEYKDGKTGRWKKVKPNVRNEAFDIDVYNYASLRVIQTKGYNLERLADKGERLFTMQTVKKKRKKRGTVSNGVEVW